MISVAFISPLNKSHRFTSAPNANLFKTNKRFQTALISPCRRAVLCSATTAAVANLKSQIASIAGEDRGIFGLEDDDRDKLDNLIQALERQTPYSSPTENDARIAAGRWRLLYTTLEILGKNRVRLAIGSSQKSGLVKLGDFFQLVDPDIKQSTNVIEFKVLTGARGTFTISASYSIVGPKRVQVCMSDSFLQPQSFANLLGENISLLTNIFNPDGFLDITYVDHELRIGRDDKGKVFVLEKLAD